MHLESQLLQGYAAKSQAKESLLKCNNCDTLYQEVFDSCDECGNHVSSFKSESLKVDAADCDICGQSVLYTRDNRVNTNYHLFGYLCTDCENITELKFGGKFYQPEEFLQNDLGQGFNATPVDSEKKEKIAWLFSLQTKVEDAGFWSYQPDEFSIWLASVDGTYCGYVSLNEEDVLNQIWVDKGYRQQRIAERMVEYLCDNILMDQNELIISQPTDDGREFFGSIENNGKVFGKDLKVSY